MKLFVFYGFLFKLGICLVLVLRMREEERERKIGREIERDKKKLRVLWEREIEIKELGVFRKWIFLSMVIF